MRWDYILEMDFSLTDCVGQKKVFVLPWFPTRIWVLTSHEKLGKFSARVPHLHFFFSWLLTMGDLLFKVVSSRSHNWEMDYFLQLNSPHFCAKSADAQCFSRLISWPKWLFHVFTFGSFRILAWFWPSLAMHGQSLLQDTGNNTEK